MSKMTKFEIEKELYNVYCDEMIEVEIDEIKTLVDFIFEQQVFSYFDFTSCVDGFLLGLSLVK